MYVLCSDNVGALVSASLTTIVQDWLVARWRAMWRGGVCGFVPSLPLSPVSRTQCMQHRPSLWSAFLPLTLAHSLQKERETPMTNAPMIRTYTYTSTSNLASVALSHSPQLLAFASIPRCCYPRLADRPSYKHLHQSTGSLFDQHIWNQRRVRRHATPHHKPTFRALVRNNTLYRIRMGPLPAT